MPTVAIPTIAEDIWQDVWDEERAWREEGLDREQAPDPLALVIFGATGDLAHRKLVPALYSLATSNLLPEKLAVVGFGRSQRGEDDFRRGLRDAVDAAGTRVRDIAEEISPRLAQAALAGVVDGRMVDLAYPIAKDAAPNSPSRLRSHSIAHINLQAR